MSESQIANFRILPIDQVAESPTNPRRSFSEQGLKDLTDSIRKRGVLVPLLVRPVNAHFEIIAGARRFRAATAAGLTELPAHVKQMDDAEAAELQIIDNLIREDVHPFEEALGYKALLKRPGYDIPGIAARVAKSESYIYQRMKLLDLIKHAQEAFLNDRITVGHASLIARLQHADQENALDACYDRHATKSNEPVLVGVRQLAGWIQQNIHLDLHAAPFSKTATDLGITTPCVGCAKRTGFMPQLFPDIAHKDTCTHPSCYQMKLKAHIARRKEESVRKGTPLLEVSQEWSNPHGQKAAKTDPVYRNAYEIVSSKNKCESVQKAIIVDGRFDLGKELLVCTDKKCKKHHGSGSYTRERSPKEVTTEKEATRKRKVEIAIRTSAMDRALEKAKTLHELPKEALYLFAETIVAEMHHDLVKFILKRHGWAPDKDDKYPDVREVTKSTIINKINTQELNAFLLECCLTRYVDLAAWEVLDRPDEFLRAIHDFGVDITTVETETRAALGETTKAKPETKQSKKKTKAAKK